MASGVAALLLLLVGGPALASAQTPPAGVTVDPCSIMSLFQHLTAITAAPECRAGCAGGSCPASWYPGAADECSAACGATFEPFCASHAQPLSVAHSRRAPAAALVTHSLRRAPAALALQQEHLLLCARLAHLSPWASLCNTRRGPVRRHAHAGADGRHG